MAVRREQVHEDGVARDARAARPGEDERRGRANAAGYRGAVPSGGGAGAMAARTGPLSDETARRRGRARRDGRGWGRGDERRGCGGRGPGDRHRGPSRTQRPGIGPDDRDEESGETGARGDKPGGNTRWRAIAMGPRAGASGPGTRETRGAPGAGSEGTGKRGGGAVGGAPGGGRAGPGRGGHHGGGGARGGGMKRTGRRKGERRNLVARRQGGTTPGQRDGWGDDPGEHVRRVGRPERSGRRKRHAASPIARQRRGRHGIGRRSCGHASIEYDR